MKFQRLHLQYPNSKQEKTRGNQNLRHLSPDSVDFSSDLFFNLNFMSQLTAIADVGSLLDLSMRVLIQTCIKLYHFGGVSARVLLRKQ